MMLGFCIVGAGRIGPIHARHIAAGENASLKYVADIEADAAARLAGEHGATAIADPDAAFADPEVGLAVAITINKMAYPLPGEGTTLEITDLIRSELGC